MARWIIVVLFINGLVPLEQGFYVPGVAPVEFKINDPIEVKSIIGHMRADDVNMQPADC
ncbi:unnamed protein product [Toxocara canis]|uniref:Secreted protein n=1 Tax=Toxocara canis TaxID=6265 RepID=A0A183U426_TOXCA|nr:unnamed protein product [Toxocara canis]